MNLFLYNVVHVQKNGINLMDEKYNFFNAI